MKILKPLYNFIVYVILPFVAALGIFICILFIYAYFQDAYCETHPSYIMYDACFNVSMRCKSECNHWGLEYTGKLENCLCLCNESKKVSMCSGWLIE